MVFISIDTYLQDQKIFYLNDFDINNDAETINLFINNFYLFADYPET